MPTEKVGDAFVEGFKQLMTTVIFLALFFGLIWGALWMVGETINSYRRDSVRRKWVHEHAVRILEVKFNDTIVVCDDGVKYHLYKKIF